MNYATVRDAMIAELKTAFPRVTVEAYTGQIEDLLEERPVKLPAIFVVFAGDDSEWVDGPNYNDKAMFTAMIAARSLKGAGEASADVDELVPQVKAALANKSLGLAIECLQPGATRLQLGTKTVVIYSVDFKTNYDTTYQWQGE